MHTAGVIGLRVCLKMKTNGRGIPIKRDRMAVKFDTRTGRSRPATAIRNGSQTDTRDDSRMNEQGQCSARTNPNASLIELDWRKWNWFGLVATRWAQGAVCNWSDWRCSGSLMWSDRFFLLSVSVSACGSVRRRIEPN